MDRRKSEARNHLKKLQEECNVTVELLNQLLTVCTSHVDVLENLDSKDFRLHSKYFLATTQFQYHTLQKLLEVNLTLEEHIVEQEPINIKDTPLSTSSCSNPSRDLISPINSISTDVHTSHVDKEENVTSNPLHDLISLGNVPISLDGEVENVASDLCSPVDAHIPLDDDFENTIVNSNTPDLLELDHNLDSIINQSCELDKNSPIGDAASMKAESEVSSEYFCCLSNGNDSKSVDLVFDDPFVEEEPSSTDIIDTLKALPKMTIEEKYSKSLSEVPMPDISLKPSTIKMSTVIKNNRVKCDKELVGFDHSSRKLKLSDEVIADEVVIPERSDPMVNDFCMIGYAESPSLFYIQVADEASYILDVLSSQLECLEYEKFYVSKTNARKDIGNFGCTEIEGYWYRVEILNWYFNTDRMDDQVSIQLIDYGHKRTVSYKKLRPIPKDFCHIPKMAQLCHLDSIYPPAARTGEVGDKWPNASIDGFINVCGDLETNTFCITHVSQIKTGKSFAIDLINTMENDDADSIGQILLDAKLCVEIFDDSISTNSVMIDQIRKSHGLQSMHSNMSRDDILEMFFIRNYEEETLNINEAVMHYDPRDEALTCRNLRSDGTCYKGSSCRFRHVPLTSGFTRDREEVYNNAFVDTLMPKANDEVLLTISHIIDIQCFYAQIRNREDEDYYKPTINNLIATMNKPETVKTYQKFKYPPGLSQLLIVKHWNNYWYRGRVISIQLPERNEDVVVEIFVVDFGDTLLVPLSDLRVIPRDYLSIPFQAVECRLYNIRHKKGADEAEEKRHFESRYLGQKFLANIIAVPGHLEVLLYTCDKKDDVGETLMAAGYGEPNTEHNFPIDNDVFLID